MSLYNNLRELGKREKVNIIIWSTDNDRFDTGYWPGSRMTNLNNLVMELSQFATERGCEIARIEVDEFSVSFE